MGLVVIASIWVLLNSGNSGFRFPGPKATAYFRFATISRRFGFHKTSMKFFRMANDAREDYLQSGVKSKQLTVVMFSDTRRIDFDSFFSQVDTRAKQDGIGVITIRAVPTPQHPAQYEIFVEQKDEGPIRDFVRSGLILPSPDSIRGSHLHWDPEAQGNRSIPAA